MSNGLLRMAGGIAKLAGEMLSLVHSLPDASDQEVQRRLGQIRAIEEDVDAAFDASATQIMSLEVFPVNPDYLLQIAKELDRMSDLIERTSLLLEWRQKMDEEESELLENASTQVQQLAENISTCLASLGSNRDALERTCEVIVERERAVDQIMGHYARISSRRGYEIEKRLWLGELLGNLDTMADGARDITITLRVISNKLERQNRLDVKSGTLK